MSYMSRKVGIGPSYFQRRESGLKNPLGTGNGIYRQLYSSLTPGILYNNDQNDSGGIFSLEFSPEGSLLVAACERRKIMVYDPLNQKSVLRINDAHDDCVNCVKFINSTMFATGSDDFSVALWDARYLKRNIQTFRGHNNWVKSIEYVPSSQLLLTSGFDGTVLGWDINNSNSYNELFWMNGLIRTRLTPDCSKLIMCTAGGYLMVVHNLDLNTLRDDLSNFKPNIYRLMQLSQTLLPGAMHFTHLFKGVGKRNRVDFIDDFPVGNVAEVISAVQPHPDGHSVLSRNISNDEKTEWTCVHNIEERLSSDEIDDDTEYEQMRWPSSFTSLSTAPSQVIRSTDLERLQSIEDSIADMPSVGRSVTDIWEAYAVISDVQASRQRERVAEENFVRSQLNALIPPYRYSSNGAHSRPIPSSSSQPVTSNPSESGVSRAASAPSPVSTSASTSAPNSTRVRDVLLNGNTIVSYRRSPRSFNLRARMALASTSNESGSSNSRSTNEFNNVAHRASNGESSSALLRRQTPRVRRSQRLADNQRRGLRTDYELNETARLQNLRFRALRKRRYSRHSAAGRVVFMGVYRETGPRGERGTSVHRHNIAAVTVDVDDGEDEDADDDDDEEEDEEIQSPSDSSASSAQSPNFESALGFLTRSLSRVRVNKKIHQNIPRLTHYTEEPNVGQGFIKELCFSPDGRLMCSPFGNGFRLLAFSPEMLDIRHCYPGKPPVLFSEISLNITHSDYVVSTKFSPVHHLLVSGCLSGKICFHQPFQN